MEVKRDANHRYTIDGVCVPSVTQVIKAAGYMGNTAHYTDESRDRGTYVHAVTAAWDTGNLVMEQVYALGLEYTLPYLEAWKKFRAETGFEPTEIELIVGHPTLMYAGTLDRSHRGCLTKTICDIKTGSPAPWHAIQTAAYAGCLSGIWQRCGVYLAGTGAYKLEWHEGFDDWDAFVAALSAWKWKAKHGLND